MCGVCRDRPRSRGQRRALGIANTEVSPWTWSLPSSARLTASNSQQSFYLYSPQTWSYRPMQDQDRFQLVWWVPGSELRSSWLCGKCSQPLSQPSSPPKEHLKTLPSFLSLNLLNLVWMWVCRHECGVQRATFGGQFSLTPFMWVLPAPPPVRVTDQGYHGQPLFGFLLLLLCLGYRRHHICTFTARVNYTWSCLLGLFFLKPNS